MLEKAKAIVEQIDFNPYRVPYDNEAYVDLASNNYLGLAGHPVVKQAAVAATMQYGVSLCGTPVASGYSDFAGSVAGRLAAFAGVESALLFPSCYQANNGVFSALCTKEDLIVVDQYAHSSLVEGIRAVGCKINPFLHNDCGHLEKILKRANGYRRIFVVTESVFSTEGTIAPFEQIIALCQTYGAVPVVDDSHGIGVIGKTGRGVLEHFGIEHYQGIYTASLGKALANMGGMVGGDAETMEYLRYLCPHLIYSTALTPPVLGGIMGALDVIEAEFGELGSRMWRYKQILAEAILAGQLSVESVNSAAPITSVFCGDAQTTMILCKRLYEKGILSTPFIEPSVPKHACVLRLIAGAGLQEEKVRWAAEQIRDTLSS